LVPEPDRHALKDNLAMLVVGPDILLRVLPGIDVGLDRREIDLGGIGLTNPAHERHLLLALLVFGRGVSTARRLDLIGRHLAKDRFTPRKAGGIEDRVLGQRVPSFSNWAMCSASCLSV
jgi:hypothetical protein